MGTTTKSGGGRRPVGLCATSPLWYHFISVIIVALRMYGLVVVFACTVFWFVFTNPDVPCMVVKALSIVVDSQAQIYEVIVNLTVSSFSPIQVLDAHNNESN